MKKLPLLITALFLTCSWMQAQESGLKVLFVGNSYTYGYNMPHIVSVIAKETSLPLDTRKSTLGGATLKEHWTGGSPGRNSEAYEPQSGGLRVLPQDCQPDCGPAEKIAQRSDSILEIKPFACGSFSELRYI